MRWARVLLLAAVLLLATVRGPTALTGAGLLPWWPFLLVLLVGLRARLRAAVFLSWCPGLAVDMLSLAPLGLQDNARDWRKMISGQRLWYFESRDANAWLMI